MKAKLFVFCFFSVSLLMAADGEQRIKADLKEATVYLNSARLTVTAQAVIPAGPGVVIIENLPNGINAESIQLNAKGDFVILGVQYATNYLKELKKTRLSQNLLDSLESLNDQMEILNGKTIVLQREEEMVLKNQSLAGNEQGFKVEELAKLADFYRKRLSQITEERIKLKQLKKAMQKQVDTVNNQIAELSQANNSSSGEIRVSVTSKTQVSAHITCEFLVYNAGWEPMYDIRAKNTASPVVLNFKAKVFQNSGMDWKNVKLTLSTTNPVLSGNKPELSPWYLDIYQKPVRYKPMAGRSAEDRTDMYMKSAAPVPQVETLQEAVEALTTARYTTVSQTSLATEYEISVPYTIPSSGKQEVVEIRNYTVQAFYQHSCVPKLDNDAFLMAGLTGWENLSLLAGTSNIYFENSYIGQVFIDPQIPSDTLFVSLGRDKRIVVKRENVKDYTSKKMIGTTKKEEYGYEVSVRNTKSESIDIQLEDQVPVSKNSEIEVELLEKSNAAYNQETGKLSWKFKLNPAETKKLTLRFSIKYPKNKLVSGL